LYVTLSKETKIDALQIFGLTNKEIEAYILLVKRGPLKGKEIAQKMKRNKGQVYRILKSLQKKGFAESTLEYPTRFNAIPFEKIIDSFVKTKRKELALIEESKKDLLVDWENISHTELDSSLEKFSVIEGNKKIFNKISQMVNETNNQFSMTSTVSDLIQVERFEAFEIENKHPMKSKIHYRVLTQISRQELKAIKLLKTILSPILDLRARNLSLGLSQFSRMAIRDNEEIILFISDKNKEPLKDGKEVCLITNCKSIIEAFSGVFEDLWKDSTDIEEGIIEIETGKIPPRTQIIKEPMAAKNIYYNVLDSAKEEILIVTSSNGLIGLLNEKIRLKELNDGGIIIRVMAPIIGENLNSAQKLLEFCEVRHIHEGYLETTIVDECNLFQFKYPQDDQKSDLIPFFGNTFYTNDIDYVKKTKKMIFDIWRKTRVPSVMTLEAITRGFESKNYPISKMDTRNVLRRVSPMGSLKDEFGRIGKKEVLNKFNTAKKYPITDYSEKTLPNIVRYFGTGAFALIHPPESFELPNIIIGLFKHNNKSSFGAEDVMYVYLLTDKKDSYSSENVAVIQTNPKATVFRKADHVHTLAANNIRLLRSDQFHIRKGGNTLFVGWTVPIPLIPSKYVLPPSCILFEGYGKVKPGVLSTILPSGRKNEVVYNCLEAFVTFFHPSSKYSGPGTEGFIDTELVRTSYSLIR